MSAPHTFKIVFECSDVVLRMRLGLGLSWGLRLKVRSLFVMVRVKARGWKMYLLLFMGFSLGSKVKIGKVGLGI